MLACLLITRFGGDAYGGSILRFGSNDMLFIGIGTVVGYAIIVPAILCTYLIGAFNLTFLVRHFKPAEILFEKMMISKVV